MSNIYKLRTPLTEPDYLRHTSSELRVLRNGITVEITFYSAAYAKERGWNYRRQGKDRQGKKYFWEEDGTHPTDSELDIMGWYATRHGTEYEIDGIRYKLIDPQVWNRNR